MHASSCKQQVSRACMRAMNCREQEELAAATNNGLDWLEESISFLTADVDIGGWWSSTSTPHAAQQDDIGSVVAQTLSPPAPTALAALQQAASPSIASPATASSPVSEPSSSKSSKKRKSPVHSRSSGGQSNQRKKGGGGGKGGAGSSDRDMRWAEQLLNPCAAAVEVGNLSRVQHLFYVLGELASLSGDANHRLAAHGLRALDLRVGPASGVRAPAPCPAPAASFACADPRLFRAALIRFHEVSPWFALPNALANAAILSHHQQAHRQRPRLHVADLGVSHGVQWPTLLESLTRLQPGGGGARPSVRLTTVVGPTTATTPFASSPPGYDFSPPLLRYAKSINLDLAIARAAALDSVHHAQDDDEALVVCLQFRLGHASVEERTDILNKVRAMNPGLVVLSELDAGRPGGGDGTTGMSGAFAARLEMLWRFLESTSAAFKGRDGDERRLLEAEAATSLLTADVAPGDGREAWRDRMAAAGFQEAAFGDDAVESAKSLLRKYDGGWEMASSSSSSANKVTMALRWKGQLVSFCSLWRPAPPCST